MKHKKEKSKSSADPLPSLHEDDEEISSALDSFPMRAALGIYNMNSHSPKKEEDS